MDAKVLSSDEARTRWRDIIDVGLTGQDVIIERYGKPVVAIIPYEDYVALQEALEDLRDTRLGLSVLEAWQRDPSTARPWEDVRRDLYAEARADERA